MKKMKKMALAVLLMPLLFACSGGSSTDTNLYGSLPEKYTPVRDKIAISCM